MTCDNADKKIDMKLNLTFLCASTIYQSRGEEKYDKEFYLIDDD